MKPTHEIYETLIRRGCPKHPRLWTWRDVKPDGTRVSGFALGPSGISDDDARDLLTMHAARWASQLLAAPLDPNSPAALILNGGYEPPAFDRKAWLDAAKKATLEPARPWPPAWPWPLPDLEAIEAATAHLEAK